MPKSETNINLERAKLCEAIVYFAHKLRNPTKMMIYKVLAELDYRHFNETGFPVTDLKYFAWQRGPVPKEFDKEISDRKKNMLVLPKDFSNCLHIEKELWEDKKTGKENTKFTYKPKRKADLEVFTPRQKRILEEVAFIYKDSTATQSSIASHEKNTPWDKTVKLNGKEGDLIDYFQILSPENKIDIEDVKERMKEIDNFKRNYQ